MVSSLRKVTSRAAELLGWGPILLTLLSVAPTPAAEGKAARVDSLGDPLPPGAIARLGTLRLRQQNWIHGADFSPDGKVLASVGEKSALVRLWDTASGKEVRRITAPTDQLAAVKFSPGGQVLAASDPEQHLFLWETETGKLLHRLSLPQEEATVANLAFADGGKSLVCVDNTGAVCWWSVASGARLRTWDVKEALTKPKAGPWKLSELKETAFTPDGRLLLADIIWDNAENKGDEKYLRSLAVWDLERHKQRWQRAREDEDCYAIGLSPDARVVAVAVGDGDVSLREGTDGHRLRLLEGRDKGNYWESLAFSADGKRLAAFGHGRSGLCVWEVGSGKVVHQLERSIARGIRYPPRPLLFSPDGKRLAFPREDSLALWDVDSWVERPRLPGHQEAVHFLAFSEDGKTLLSGDSSEGRGRSCPRETITWDTMTWREAARSYDVEDDHILRSRDHRLGVLWGPGREFFFTQQPGGKVLRKLGLPAAQSYNSGGFFSPSGRTAALVFPRPRQHEAQELVLVDVATGKRRGSLPALARKVFLTFTPDDRTLAWVDTEAVIHVAAVDACKELCRLGKPRGRWDHRHSLATLTFSPAGPHLAFWERESNDILIWDWQTGTQLRRLQGRKLLNARNRPILPAWPVTLTFSPDGRTLAVGGMAASHDVELWEVASGQQRRRISGHLKPVSALAFSPEGRLLASGSTDTTTLVWDLHRPPLGDRPPAQLEALWAALGHAEAGKADAAMTTLIQQPAATVLLLRQKLEPAPTVEARTIAQAVADLDSDDFEQREKAMRALEDLAERAEPALRKTLREPPSAEARRRIGSLLDKLRQPPPRRLRILRAIEVLEQLRTPDARHILRRLAEGAADDRMTREARASLQRLERTPAGRP